MRWPAAVALVLAVALSAGCQRQDVKEARRAAASASKDTVSVMTDSVNYMHERSVKYTLYDISQTPPLAVGGAIVDRLGTGGEKGCCIALPRTWRPGIRMRLQWHESDRDNIYEDHTRDLEVPRYDTPGDLYVVFYPHQEVELVVSVGEPGHPEWRGRIKQTPWENCLEVADRKVCKAALPIYGGLDWSEMQGYCTYLKETGGNLLNCEETIQECVRNYEDEDRCRKTLWGERKK